MPNTPRSNPRRAVPRTLVLVVGAILGASTWGVAFAVDPGDTIVVCHRPGADLRAPASNGTCPSGYTKTEISDGADGVDGVDGAPGQDGAPGADATNPAFHGEGHDVGFTQAGVMVLVASVAVPAGSYAVTADGEFTAGTGAALEQCIVRIADGGPDASTVAWTDLGQNQALDQREHGGLSTIATLEDPGVIALRCAVQHATDVTAASTTWRMNAVQVSSISGT